MKKPEKKELFPAPETGEEILDLEEPTSVVSMSDCTGLLAAIPASQEELLALQEIVRARIPRASLTAQNDKDPKVHKTGAPRNGNR